MKPWKDMFATVKHKKVRVLLDDLILKQELQLL